MTDEFLDDLRTLASNAGAACGPRCPGNRIPLTPYEVARMADGMGISTGELIRVYLQAESRLLAVKSDGSCVFHRPTGCEVHADRPMACRSFAEPADGAGRFVERARQYRDVLRAWVAVRAAATAGGADPEAEVRAVPEPGLSLLDVDAMVADVCRERGLAIPDDLEQRIDLHLEALRSAIR